MMLSWDGSVDTIGETFCPNLRDTPLRTRQLFSVSQLLLT